MSRIYLNQLSYAYKLKIEADNSTFYRRRYKSRYALKDMCLDFRAGDIVGLIGKNGSGKSTLLKVLSGNLFPTKGTVTIDGEMLSLLDRHSGTMLAATLYENAKLKAALLGLKGDGINEFVHNCVEDSGLQERINEPLKNLSTGMAGRFNLALNTQIVKPISILDEWISTLDTQAVRHRGMLERLTREADIVVLASHNKELVQRICNRVVLLSGGEIVYDGDDVEYAYRLLEPIPNLELGTEKSELVSSVIGKKRKEVLHYLNVSKTANCLVKELVAHGESEKYDIKLHPDTVHLRDIPQGEKVFFLYKNPIERFARSFIVRKNKGAPMYVGKWNVYEYEIFKKYDSPEQLALLISSNSVIEMLAACRDMGRIFHVNRHMTDWFENVDYLEQRRGDIYFVENTEDIDKLLSNLQKKLGIVAKPELFEYEMMPFLKLNHADRLSSIAKTNIRRWYEADMAIFRWLKLLRNEDESKL